MKKILFLTLILAAGCTTTKKSIQEETPPILQNNFKVSIWDSHVKDPRNDRRCFYRIYINKQPVGRTTTGLESQLKTFETELEPNNHLLRIEKWVLDEENGRYVKLNNIEQPKPDYIYFIVKKNEQTSIMAQTGRYGKTTFSGGR